MIGLVVLLLLEALASVNAQGLSVRFVNGTSAWCAGRVEVKYNDRPWVSVCEGDFDLKDAEVVCRELGCGAPSVLQGALYGEGKAPMWTKEFQCEGSESVLVACGTSDSTRNTCSPDKAVGLTCSESEFRLVGGSSLCAGRLEAKDVERGIWRGLDGYDWSLYSAGVVCGLLDCGSVVSLEIASDSGLMLGCSESARLVNRASACSGRVEVKSDQLWASVCEGDFDQQDAEVVCRELGCGSPSVLQGALYGEGKAPMWTKEFQCEGNESALLDCGTSDSTRNTCSPDKAVGLTCSEPDDVRLVGGASRCAGTLETKLQGVWRPTHSYNWYQNPATVVCRQLECGSAVAHGRTGGHAEQDVWWVPLLSDGTENSLRECGIQQISTSTYRLELFCSDMLFKPNITIFPSIKGVSEGQQQGLQVGSKHSLSTVNVNDFKVMEGSDFTVSCSIQPQYPGGSFDLTFTGPDTTSSTPYNHTQTAVNHSNHTQTAVNHSNHTQTAVSRSNQSANFLFAAADHTHQGKYACVYRVSVMVDVVTSRSFSSESEAVAVSVT